MLRQLPPPLEQTPPKLKARLHKGLGSDLDRIGGLIYSRNVEPLLS